MAGRALGRCHHPARQSLGTAPIVRAAELRCRRGFDIDDWMPASLAATIEQQDIVLSERPAPLRRRPPKLPIPQIAAAEEQPAAD
jgi:hypothetical protein